MPTREGHNQGRKVMRRYGLGVATLACLLLTGELVAQSESDEILRSTYEAAEQAFREQRLDEAEAGYARLAKLRPETAEVHAKLGLIYYVTARFRDAVPAFRKALELKSGLPSVGTLLAISLAQLAEYDEALPGLEKGFEQPEDKALQRLVGLELQRAYVALDRTAEAGRITSRLTGLYPDDPEILYHAGRFHADMATMAMRRLVSIAPDSVWGHQAAAEALESQGNYGLAIVEYRKAIEKQPSRPGVHYSIARAIQASEGQAGTDQDALDEFRNELRIDPSNALAAYEAGEILRKASQYLEARAFFDQAVAYRPRFGLARVGLGRVLRELEEPEDAKVHLEAAVRLRPANEVARYQLALVYRTLGDLEGAQRQMGEFQRLRRNKRDQPEQSRLVGSVEEVTPQLLDAR